MELETKNTDALFYEINNFHLVWQKVYDEKTAKKYKRSEYLLFYNGSNMWDVYSAGNGIDYENKMLSLYKECKKEISNNLLLLNSMQDRISYLKKILPNFYLDEPSKEPETYLSIQENNVQLNINWLTGHNFMADGGCPNGDFISIYISGFDSKEFEHCAYRCLNEQEEFYLDDLSKEDNEYWNIRHSFVKTILSIKKKTKEKLEQQINKWIKIEQGEERESDTTLTGTETKKKSKNKLENQDKNYSQKQITIAYCVMGIPITTENATIILSKHSQTKSAAKFLTKRI